MMMQSARSFSSALFLGLALLSVPAFGETADDANDDDAAALAETATNAGTPSTMSLYHGGHRGHGRWHGPGCGGGHQGGGHQGGGHQGGGNPGQGGGNPGQGGGNPGQGGGNPGQGRDCRNSNNDFPECPGRDPNMPDVPLPPVGDIPYCDVLDGNPNNDGIEWEDGRPCRNHTPGGGNYVATCQNVWAGETTGWGFENGGACRMPSWNYPWCSKRVDADGDGFGWENNKACRLI